LALVVAPRKEVWVMSGKHGKETPADRTAIMLVCAVAAAGRP
jgi:hypothetical protein